MIVRQFLLFAVIIDCTYARIIGAFVLPHGGIALNPSQFDSPSKLAKQWAWSLHRSAVDVGRYIQRLAPDVLLLSTPHGVADLQRFQIYLNARANGTATTDNCQCPPCCYDVDVPMDARLATVLVANLSRDGLNVSGTAFFGPPGESDEKSPLRWGEVIPLIFIRDLVNTKVIVLSQPSRRYNQSVSMIPELIELGHQLYDRLEALPESVVVVISADLAHTHEATGPYGFSKSAEPFDRNVGNWATTMHPSYLLDKAAVYADDAKSCGYTGLVMLHGLLQAGKLASWLPVMHANFHPSYYGMMVASFSRISQSSTADENAVRIEESLEEDAIPQFPTTTASTTTSRPTSPLHGDQVRCPNCTYRRRISRRASSFNYRR